MLACITHTSLRLVFACGVVAVLLFDHAAPAAAGPVIRSGDTVSIEAQQVVEGDLYASGRTVAISGEVLGDAYLAGANVTLNAPVSQDIVALGGVVQLHAPVADDVRIVGGEVVIAEAVEGDVVVAAGTVQLLSTARIEGDLIVAAGSVVVGGAVEGSVFGMVDTMRIDATVGGTVDVRAERGLTLGDRAHILGDIVYVGTHDIMRGAGAVVVGQVQERQPAADTSLLEVIALSLFTLLFGAFVALLIARPFLTALVEDATRSYGRYGLIGLLLLIGVPVLSFLLMVSVVGLLVGLALMALYAALLFIAWIIAGPILGGVIFSYIKKDAPTLSLLAVMGGVFLFEALIFIPVLGPLLVLAIFAIALGGLAEKMYTHLR